MNTIIPAQKTATATVAVQPLPLTFEEAMALQQIHQGSTDLKLGIRGVTLSKLHPQQRQGLTTHLKATAAVIAATLSVIESLNS